MFKKFEAAGPDTARKRKKRGETRMVLVMQKFLNN